jgi:uncharacterized protein YodC (DUF2158 family)
MGEFSGSYKHNFKNGDIVELITGGPLIIIQSIAIDSYVDRANCYWFDKNNCLINNIIPVNILRKSEHVGGSQN